MPTCEQCNGPVIRTHRLPWEKLFFLVVYKCRECGRRNRTSYIGGTLVNLHVVCPRCGSHSPVRRKKADKIDSMMRSPYRLLHMLLGGRLYHCTYCRLQFNDIRPLRPEPQPADQQQDTRANTATTVN